MPLLSKESRNPSNIYNLNIFESISDTLQGTNLSHLGQKMAKGKPSWTNALEGDMFVSRMAINLQSFPDIADIWKPEKLWDGPPRAAEKKREVNPYVWMSKVTYKQYL